MNVEPNVPTNEQTVLPAFNGLFVVVLALLLTSCEGREADSAPSAVAPSSTTESGLHIGVLLDHSGLLGDYGRTGDDGIALALDHINQAGGVLGKPVHVTFVDAATDLAATVAGARNLSREHQVQAILGPLGSAAALAVAHEVSIPDRVPTISPTATSPEITELADDGFVFRAMPSDATQAPILATLAALEGARHLAVFYQDDSYGRGLVEAVATHFQGVVTRQPIDTEEATTFESELRAAAAAGADTLVAMSYVPTAAIYLREAAELALFERVLLVDATASTDLVKALGAEAVEGFKGTAPYGSLASTDSLAALAFGGMFEDASGRPVTSGLEALAYDITVCIAFAAEHAGQLDRVAIRDALPTVCGRGGEIVRPGADEIARGLAALRAGQDVDYEGASGSLEWDPRGDLMTGSITIWTFEAGEIVVLESLPFDLR